MSAAAAEDHAAEADAENNDATPRLTARLHRQARFTHQLSSPDPSAARQQPDAPPDEGVTYLPDSPPQ
jgi:hypothetical protein